MARQHIHTYFSIIAMVVASRGTCPRLQVGCVLVDVRRHVIATGYNGKASGLSHCSETPCPGGGLQTGLGTGTCEAIHAEANALLQCQDVYKIETAYVTHSPCKACIKLLLNTSCETIVFTSKSEGVHTEALKLWKEAGRSIIYWDMEGDTLLNYY